MVKERILLTGGAGYLGSVMTRHFLQAGNEVTCLDNLMYSQQSPLFFVGSSNYSFVYGDVRDERLMLNLAKDKDVIIPLAAIVGFPACDKRTDDARAVNFEAVRYLNNLRSNQQMMIFPTTNSGYGATTGEFNCDENTPLNPLSVYGETKVAAERVLLEDKKEAISFRLATVFGISHRMRLDLLVNDLTYRALEQKRLELFEKHFKRNFVHIEDVACVFEHAINNYGSMTKMRVFNVGHPKANVSKEELVMKIKVQVPNLEIVEVERQDPDKRNYIVSNERLLSTGFTFTHTLEEGIGELIRAYPLFNVPSIYAVSRNI